MLAGEPKVELKSPVCATVEPTIEKSDENLGPRKSFEDILQAAELLSQNGKTFFSVSFFFKKKFHVLNKLLKKTSENPLT